MKVKLVDSKGRVGLGSKFAGKLVIVDDSPEQIIITLSVAIPCRWFDCTKNGVGITHSDTGETHEGGVLEVDG